MDLSQPSPLIPEDRLKEALMASKESLVKVVNEWSYDLTAADGSAQSVGVRACFGAMFQHFSYDFQQPDLHVPLKTLRGFGATTEFRQQQKRLNTALDTWATPYLHFCAEQGLDPFFVKLSIATALEHLGNEITRGLTPSTGLFKQAIAAAAPAAAKTAAQRRT